MVDASALDGSDPPERIVVQWAASGLLQALSRALDDLPQPGTAALGEEIRARSQLGRLAGTTARYLAALTSVDDAIGSDARSSLYCLTFDLNGAASGAELVAQAYYDFMTSDRLPAPTPEDFPAELAGIQIRSMMKLRAVLASAEDPLTYSRPHDAAGDEA